MNELGVKPSRRAAEKICQEALSRKSAQERVEWALNTLPGKHIVSSSFGAQSAVMLHLLSEQKPDIPVVVIDTGYLFPETYRFIDELTERLGLNLHIVRAEMSAAWQEARYGRRWEHGIEGIDAYNRDNKVEPMERALKELDVGTWFAGIRRNQSSERAKTAFIESSGERWKVASDRRLVGSRRLPIFEAIRPAVSSIVGQGLRVDRRCAYNPHAGGCRLAR